MRLFKKAKETMETQENRPVMQHDLPKNYNGAYKLLGKNVKTPIEPAGGTNTLVLGFASIRQNFFLCLFKFKKSKRSFQFSDLHSKSRFQTIQKNASISYGNRN